MNIAVIGANGGVGRQTMLAALSAGHRVTAIVRNPANLSLTQAELASISAIPGQLSVSSPQFTHPLLEIVKGDLFQPGSFENHLAGKDAVISAIGTKSTAPTTLYSEGNRRLLNAMKEKGTERVFFISASALEISPVLPFYVRLAEKYILQKILRNMYADLRLMEQLVKGYDMPWTIMRPPRLTDRPATGRYRIAVDAFLKNCLSISRADLAHFMLNNTTNKDIFQATVEIGY